MPAADNMDFIYLATVAVDTALCGLMNEINNRVSSEFANFLRPSVRNMYPVNVYGATGHKDLSSGKERNSTFRVNFPALNVFKSSNIIKVKELLEFFQKLDI